MCLRYICLFRDCSSFIEVSPCGDFCVPHEDNCLRMRGYVCRQHYLCNWLEDESSSDVREASVTDKRTLNEVCYPRLCETTVEDICRELNLDVRSVEAHDPGLGYRFKSSLSTFHPSSLDKMLEPSVATGEGWFESQLFPGFEAIHIAGERVTASLGYAYAPEADRSPLRDMTVSGTSDLHGNTAHHPSVWDALHGEGRAVGIPDDDSQRNPCFWPAGVDPIPLKPQAEIVLGGPEGRSGRRTTRSASFVTGRGGNPNSRARRLSRARGDCAFNAANLYCEEELVNCPRAAEDLCEAINTPSDRVCVGCGTRIPLAIRRKASARHVTVRFHGGHRASYLPS